MKQVYEELGVIENGFSLTKALEVLGKASKRYQEGGFTSARLEFEYAPKGEVAIIAGLRPETELELKERLKMEEDQKAWDLKAEELRKKIRYEEYLRLKAEFEPS